MLDGYADVLVSDGFTGNIIIKLIEGIMGHTYDWISSDNKIKKSNEAMESIYVQFAIE